MVQKNIGILVGHEWSWPPAFLTEINRRNVGVTADLIKLDGTRMAEPCTYNVIIDRISHEIPYYRIFLKNAMLMGTVVLNNPLWSTAYDRFFNAALVTRLGFAHPRTVALPTYTHHEGIDDDALQNLHQSIPWQAYIDYLGGFPVVLRPVRDTMLKRIYVIESYDDLERTYSLTGSTPMMLREHLRWDKYVRCLCIGAAVQPVKYTPGSAWSTRYHIDEHYLTPAERGQVIESALIINQALGFDINAIDFALCDGQLYAVDVTNPVPNFDVGYLTPYFFDWVVKTMADYTIRLALDNNGCINHQIDAFPWGKAVRAQASTPDTVTIKPPQCTIGPHGQQREATAAAAIRQLIMDD